MIMFGKKQDHKQYDWEELQKRIEVVLREILGKPGEEVGTLIREIKDLVGPKVEIPKLKKQIAELRVERECAERDIQHLVKLKLEKNEIELQKKELLMKHEFQDKELALQREYHDKVLTQLETARTEMKEVYRDIMARLPNVNMQMHNCNQPPAPEKKAD